MKHKPSYKADFLVVGCGFAGATYARLAAESGFTSHVIDARSHVGGNCFSFRDEQTGVEIHKYGPHIFHTDDESIWKFVNRFTGFNSYINRVKASTKGTVYSMPINLHTMNQFFKKTLNPSEAKLFIDSIRLKEISVTNFEEYFLLHLGRDLYEAFFRDYTMKQWGVNPRDIQVSTAKRIPIRFNYDDNYYDDRFQGIPVDGYTKIFERILERKEIKVYLGTSFEEFRATWRSNYRWLVFTGSLDDYFGSQYGLLPYRTVSFKELRGKEIQGTAVINFTDMSVPYTRVHEHKWFMPERKFEQSVAFEEYSSASNSRVDPYYPVRNPQSEVTYRRYEEASTGEEDVIFIGRLAEFRYYDMHQVIGSSIAKFRSFAKKRM